MIHRLPLIVPPAHRRPKVSLSSGGGGSGAEPFFSDSFDNGQRNPANGFIMFPNAGSPTVVSGVAHTGTHSLRFHFPGKPGNDEWVEERFTMGRQLNEVWLEFWIHIPSNYYHRDNGADNNKFFAMWGGGHDAYTVGGRAKVVLELWHTHIVNGDSRMRVMLNPAGSVTSETLDYIDPVITASGPMFRGQWNRFRYYAKVGAGPNQGAIKIWIGDSLAYSNLAVNLYPSPANAPYFDVGYFMGWANSAYAEDTTFHIDDVSFWDSDPGW